MTDNIAMLKGYGGNIGVMKGDDGVLMIDTQFAQFEDGIREAMAKFTDGNPTYVVNTHWHGDHVGGNLGFGKDGLLIAHQNVRARMKTGGRGNGPADPAALPEITFDDGLTLHWNGEAVHVLHLPVGHTDGHSVVIFSIVMGSLWLATVPLTSGLVGHIYGMKFMGTLYGIVFFSHQLGGFLGVWLGGLFYDQFGNYDLVWWVGIGVGAFSAIIHLPVREKPMVMNVAPQLKTT